MPALPWLVVELSTASTIGAPAEIPAVNMIYLLYPEGLCMVASISLYSCHDRDVRVCLAGVCCKLAEMRARALHTDDSKEHQRKVTACANVTCIDQSRLLRHTQNYDVHCTLEQVARTQHFSTACSTMHNPDQCRCKYAACQHSMINHATDNAAMPSLLTPYLQKTPCLEQASCTPSIQQPPQIPQGAAGMLPHTLP